MYNSIQKPGAQFIPNDFLLLKNLGPKIIIAGDLNAKHPSWYSRITNPAGTELYDALPILGLTLTASTEPTHYPINGGRPDIIDISLHHDIQMMEDPNSINALDSDHNPVCFNIHHFHHIPTPRLPQVQTKDGTIPSTNN